MDVQHPPALAHQQGKGQGLRTFFFPEALFFGAAQNAGALARAAAPAADRLLGKILGQHALGVAQNGEGNDPLGDVLGQSTRVAANHHHQPGIQQLGMVLRIGQNVMPGDGVAKIAQKHHAYRLFVRTKAVKIVCGVVGRIKRKTLDHVPLSKTLFHGGSSLGGRAGRAAVFQSGAGLGPAYSIILHPRPTVSTGGTPFFAQMEQMVRFAAAVL